MQTSQKNCIFVQNFAKSMNNLDDIERALAILLNEEENEIGAVSLHELAVFVNRYGISREDLEKWLAIAKMRGIFI